jgi:hypothetical protein
LSTWMPGRLQLDADGIDHITSEKWCPAEEKTTYKYYLLLI